MFDLRFNPNAVSNDGHLIPPPPPEFHENITRAFWNADGDVEGGWDANGEPRLGRVATAEEWTQRAKSKELRAEDYNGHCVIPATEDYKCAVHLTAFVNHRSPLPGSTFTGTAVPGVSAKKESQSVTKDARTTAPAARPRGPARAMNDQASVAATQQAAAALKNAPTLTEVGPIPKQAPSSRSWAAIAKTAPAPDVAGSAAGPSPAPSASAKTTAPAPVEKAKPAKQTPATTPAAAPAKNPTPAGTPFHAPMPPPDLGAGAAAGGKISWAAMFAAGDTPAAVGVSPPAGGTALPARGPLSDVPPSKEPPMPPTLPPPAQPTEPAAAPAPSAPAAPAKPLSFAEALAAGRQGKAPAAPAAGAAASLPKTASPPSDVEGSAPTRERDGVVAPLEWQQEQRRLGAAARFEDALGFVLPWKEESVSGDAPSLPGLESQPRTVKNSDDGRPPNALRFVGGLDISFVKDTSVAVASLVVLEYPSMKELHTVMDHCTMDVPYIPGYLAFREVDPLRRVIAKARAQWPEHFPQLFLVDGNGLLHYRRCGLATHLGVVIDAPTIGCAKNILNVDGLNRDEVQAAAVARAEAAGPKAPAEERAVPLVGRSGATWGYAVLTGNSKTKPIFISPGHRVSTRTAMRLALAMAPFRVVEPIRQADLRSREYVKQHFSK